MSFMLLPAKELARGRWRAILISLGMDARHLSGKHGPCPICGGDDRFRWDDKNGSGSYFCNQCGSGDGFMLAQRFTGRPFVMVAEAVRTMFQEPLPEGKTKPPATEDRRITCERIWEAAQRPSEGGPLHAYQTQRFGRPWPSNAIREAIQFKHIETNSIHPAQIARIVGPTGELINLHVTYLNHIGFKADVTTQKKVLSGKLPEGSAVRIWPAAKVMGIAEGIETAISAAVLHKMPVWAAVNGAMLSKWMPPDIAETIYVFGDNDKNFTGQAKAYALANRLVINFGKNVVVKIPPDEGWDWNDVHRDRIRQKSESSQASNTLS